MIVGLTGGIGSGKSAASAVFQRLGIGCVDADEVARQVVEPGEPALAAIAKHFGPSVLTADGQLNRAALRQRIFSDDTERRWLEALLHPLIRDRMNDQLAEQSSDYALLIAPLLFENGLDERCDTTVLVDIPESLQVQRVMARDSVDSDQARAIIERQMSRADKRARAAHILDNSGSLAELEAAVVALHQRFMAKLAPNTRNSGSRYDD